MHNPCTLPGLPVADSVLLPDFLLPKKGAKETGFNFKDFSALTELADKPENKGSGDTAGLGVTALCCPHSV